MLNSISWAEYIMGVAVVSAAYYLYVAARYFSADIKDILAGKRKLQFRTAMVIHGRDSEVFSAPGNDTDDGATGMPDNDFDAVEALIGRLKTVIADASGRKLIPQEFRQYLSMVLKEYPSLQYSPLRPSVNELIISECEKYGVVTLSEEEAELLWKEAK